MRACLWFGLWCCVCFGGWWFAVFVLIVCMMYCYHMSFGVFCWVGVVGRFVLHLGLYMCCWFRWVLNCCFEPFFLVCYVALVFCVVRWCVLFAVDVFPCCCFHCVVVVCVYTYVRVSLILGKKSYWFNMFKSNCFTMHLNVPNHPNQSIRKRLCGYSHE